jgi:hypothetical protein
VTRHLELIMFFHGGFDERIFAVFPLERLRQMFFGTQNVIDAGTIKLKNNLFEYR